MPGSIEVVGRVINGDTGMTVGYVMPVGGGQFEAVLLVGVHESEVAAYKRVSLVAEVMRQAQEEMKNG